jgi:hypothetical protein
VVVAIAFSGTRAWAWDLRAFYNAAIDYVNNVNPYPAAHLSALTGQEVFVYPLPAAVAFVPLLLLPWPVATIVFALLMVACVAGTLYVLGVRDRRIYVVALLALPTQQAVLLGTISPLLALLLALLWRYRDRRWTAAALLAVLVVSKLFLWPLGLWLLATRRFKAVAYGAGLAVASLVVASVPYGLSIMRDYRDVLSLLSRFESTFSFSPFSFFRAAGLPQHAALAASAAVALILVGLLVVAASRRDELLAFRAALALAFVCSPIVWGHYFIILMVPLALMRPTFGAVWLALAWLPSDAVAFVHHRALWIGLALLLAAVQLGLTPEWRRLPRVTEPAFGALCAALLVGAIYLGHARTLTVASLTPTSNASAADGTAMLQVQRDGSSACWHIWTEKLSGPVSARILGPGGGSFALPVTLRSDGSASGCAPVANRGLARGLALDPAGAYALRLHARGSGVTLWGAVKRRENVGQPPRG